MKIGIMGGTFDPVHYGHLFIAEHVKEQAGLDKILFIPTGDPPHKNQKKITDKKDRYAMTKLAVQDNPDFMLSSIETDRETTCYTADTAAELEKLYPGTDFYYIVGADALRDMAGWRNPVEFLSKLHILAVDRVTEDNVDTEVAAQALRDTFDAKIDVLHLPLIEISSTEIREKLKNRQSVRYMLPDAVIDYITNRKLYSGKDL